MLLQSVRTLFTTDNEMLIARLINQLIHKVLVVPAAHSDCSFIKRKDRNKYFGGVSYKYFQVLADLTQERG